MGGKTATAGFPPTSALTCVLLSACAGSCPSSYSSCPSVLMWKQWSPFKLACLYDVNTGNNISSQFSSKANQVHFHFYIFPLLIYKQREVLFGENKGKSHKNNIL